MNDGNSSHCPQISDDQIAKLSDSALADLFSEVSNASGMLMHLVDEDPTYETEFQSYYNLYIKLKNRIIEILKDGAAGNDIDLLPYHDAVLPFMERYAYKNHSGWWDKKRLSFNNM